MLCVLSHRSPDYGYDISLILKNLSHYPYHVAKRTVKIAEWEIKRIVEYFAGGVVGLPLFW